jgi:phosphopantothenoylcysteine synthetase/decarboxylase
MACSFMLNRETKECDVPLYPPMIAKYRKQDKKLKTSKLKTKTEDYTTKMVEGVELIHHLGKIYITQLL